MVISLESQKVKIKRSVYIPRKRLYNIKIKKIDFKIPNISINLKHIPYIIGIFMFLILFSKGCIFFIPKYNTLVNLDSIILPVHRADILSKKLIDNYDESINDSYFSEVRIYRGETLSSLSIKYGISKDTILQVNGITDIRKLPELSSLIMPVTDGYKYKVASKDSLESISRRYNVPSNNIFRVNGLTSESLSGYKTLFIPGVNPVDWGWKSNVSKYFVYPLNGFISKRYGFFTNSITGITSFYEGIDLVPNDGDDVFASKAGYISRIGYSPNYGNYLYIDHHGGTRSLYAHMDEINVIKHQTVKQGDVIGLVGKSGFTNTTKLFFSIFNRDKTINPEEYLK